jgi:hypothetical protein
MLRLLPAATANGAERPKPFSCAKPTNFDFSSPNFTVQDHILSTAGDALGSNNQDPPEHHLLEGSYDSVVDERH